MVEREEPPVVEREKPDVVGGRIPEVVEVLGEVLDVDLGRERLERPEGAHATAERVAVALQSLPRHLGVVAVDPLGSGGLQLLDGLVVAEKRRQPRDEQLCRRGLEDRHATGQAGLLKPLEHRLAPHCEPSLREVSCGRAEGV